MRIAFFVKPSLYALATLLFLSPITPIHAIGVILDRTRIIYPLESRKMTIEIYNSNPHPVLVQLWTDKGDPFADVVTTKVPMVVIPPVVKLQPNEKRFIDLSITDKSYFDAENESLLWFNSQEIMPLNNDENLSTMNKIDLSLVTRAKIFIRPNKLRAKGSDWWIVQLQCLVNNAIFAVTCVNPTPYHVTISRVSTTVNGQEYDVEGAMIAPLGKYQFTFDKTVHLNKAEIDITVIQDNGFAKKITLSDLK